MFRAILKRFSYADNFLRVSTGKLRYVVYVTDMNIFFRKSFRKCFFCLRKNTRISPRTFFSTQSTFLLMLILNTDAVHPLIA